jgi:hypothetical protein
MKPAISGGRYNWYYQTNDEEDVLALKQISKHFNNDGIKDAQAKVKDANTQANETFNAK